MVEAKRCWEREHGVLVDRWIDSAGLQNVCYRQEPVADEADRARRLARISGGERSASYSMHGDDSPEHLDALLAGIGAGSFPDLSLLPYADDPRVRPAVLRFVETHEPEGPVQNAIQALGFLGGAGALAVLRAKALPLSELPETWADDEFSNPLASALRCVCAAILRLDPQDEAAARLVVRLLEHPCAANRKSAVWTAAEQLDRPTSHTPVARLLRRALLEVCRADDEMFIAGGTTMQWIADDFEERTLGILERVTDRNEQEQIVANLCRLGLPLSGPIVAALRRTVANASELRQAADLATMLSAILPETTLAEVAARALASPSPSLRTLGDGLLKWLTPQTATSIAAHALADEPDPLIATQLSVHVGR